MTFMVTSTKKSQKCKVKIYYYPPVHIVEVFNVRTELGERVRPKKSLHRLIGVLNGWLATTIVVLEYIRNVVIGYEVIVSI